MTAGLLGVLGVGLFVTMRAAPDPTTTPVAFKLQDVRDATRTSSFQPGDRRPTVINFFGSWCEPCRKELPALEAAHQKFPAVRFIGVDHTDGREPAVEMLAHAGVTYAAGYDPTGRVAATYGLRGMPTTIFVSAAGRAEVHRGRLSAAEIERRVARLTLQAGRS
jgi:thiol-disulfide isomerase/thioredoxin